MDTREVKDVVERAGRYVTNGSAAVKVQEQPKIREPQKKQVQRQKQHQQKKTGLNGVLQNLPTIVKAEMVITLIVVAAVVIGLTVMQISVASLTAKNNAMISEINELETRTLNLIEEIDSEVDMNEVYAVIESEGMVHPQSAIAVNP